MNILKEKFYNFAVSDFDNTLLRTDKTISSKSLDAVERFINNGGIFCVCTGRMTSSIMSYCKKYNLGGYVISYNGAEIVEVATGKKVYVNHVDNLACIKLLKYAEENNFVIQTYPNDQLLVEKEDEKVRSYSNIVKVPIIESGQKLSDFFSNNSSYTSAKVLLYTDDSTAEVMLNQIKAFLGDEYNVVRSNEFHIDVVKRGVSKGEAIVALAKLLNLDMNKLICFGDERNDISMLKVAKLGVACENGNSELKSVADYITKSCDEDGVAEALIKFGV